MARKKVKLFHPPQKSSLELLKEETIAELATQYKVTSKKHTKLEKIVFSFIFGRAITA